MRSILFVALVLFASPALAVTPLSYVVVTDQSLASSFAPLAAAHGAAEVHTMQEIQALYPVAADDAERVRLYLKDLHVQRGLKFALLGGDDPLVPMRRAYIRGPFGDILLPTDEYYACLSGTWDADGDGRYGENPNPGTGDLGDGQVLVPDLAVGRAPVSTPLEAQLFVDKAIAFAALDPSRPIKALLAADALPIGPDTLDTAPNAESLVPILSAHPGTHFVKLYQRWYAWPGAFPESRGSLLDSLNAGYDLAYLDGSGGSGIFQAGVAPTDYVFANEFGTRTNARPGLAFFMSAFTTQPGAGSVGRAFVLAPLGGATSVIGASDIQFISLGGEFARGFFHQAIELHAPTQGEAMAATVAALVTFSTSDNARLTTLGNVLFGDPALPVTGSAEVPVPVRLAFVDAETSPGEARLTWFASDASGAPIVERTSGGEWLALGEARSLGQGSYDYVDRVPGGRYGYRLRIGGDVSDEAWVDVPAGVASLALAGFRPNPASAGRTVSFTLASSEPATLQLFDVRGRTMARRDVGSLGPGPHTVDLGGDLKPGVYWLRLVQGAAVRETRGVIAR